MWARLHRVVAHLSTAELHHRLEYWVVLRASKTADAAALELVMQQATEQL